LTLRNGSHDRKPNVANNEKIRIKGWGIISIFPKKIQDVFYVEKYSISLLSISKLTKDLNCEVIFKKKNVIFQDPLTKEEIGEGYLENCRYFFSTNKSYFNAKKRTIYMKYGTSEWVTLLIRF
jgi:hypothetical protein